MKFNKCESCGHEFLVSRASCYQCGSGEIVKIDITSGTVIEVVSLVATPDPYPETYSIVLFETPSGTKGFCRTTEDLSPGDSITISEDDLGPVCSGS